MIANASTLEAFEKVRGVFGFRNPFKSGGFWRYWEKERVEHNGVVVAERLCCREIIVRVRCRAWEVRCGFLSILS